MRPRSWTENQLREAAKSSYSIRQVIKKLGLKPAGGNYYQLHQYIREYGVDTTHFRGMAWNKDLKGTGRSRHRIEEVLVKGRPFQSYKLKLRLFREGLKQRECEECGWNKVTQDGYLPLELDHINGDHSDNRLENLRVLCPNCHSLKPTHRGRNRKRKAKVN